MRRDKPAERLSELKYLYVEVLATHSGSESCVLPREGLCEALTGVRAGWGLSLEIKVPVADPVGVRGRPWREGRFGETFAEPARSVNLGMYAKAFLHENREALCSFDAASSERTVNPKGARR